MSDDKSEWKTEAVTHYVAGTGAGSGIFNMYAIVNDVLGERPETGDSMAYMFRRFGYSFYGHDRHKHLYSWTLTTPMDDVYVDVYPYSVGCGFGYFISEALDRELTVEAMANRRSYGKTPPPENSARWPVYQALRATIADLFRPVYIRDAPINIMGRLDDGELSSLPTEVDQSEMAGYGLYELVQAYQSSESRKRWFELMDKIKKSGGGDFNKGVEVHLNSIPEMLLEGLYIDGEHHKQYALMQIANVLGVDFSAEEYPPEPGIAP